VPIVVDRNDVADLEPPLAHVSDSLVELPRPFIKMDNGEFHLDAEEL
jgi:hypothetical protein